MIHSSKIKDCTIGDFYIPKVIHRTDCKEHERIQGDPCWFVLTSAGDILPAVCAARTYRAGFVGSVSPHSLQISRKRY